MAEREEVVIDDEQDDLEPEVEEEETDEAEESEPEDEDQEESPDDEEPDEDEEEERVVVIGDEEPDEEEKEAPGWVKKVRKVNRKLESENRRLKRELEQRSTAAEKPPIEVGEKPTLKSVGYDDKKYEKALAEYYERKRQAEQYEAEKAKKLEEQQKQWQERQQRYVTQKEAHGFRDFDDAEELVANTFSVTQQGIIVQGAEDSALVIYALGKNPKKLEELSKVTDPVEFAFKVAKLESQLKVTNRKAPSPEKRVKGAKNGGLSGSEDQTLARLRAEAEKTGDYTKVIKYRQKKRAK